MQKISGALFDLDGVLVDTAKFHYLAWKELAQQLGFDFSEADNERLKGVSRTRSLEILLEIGGISASEEQKAAWAERKNNRYVEYLQALSQDALLPGTRDYLTALKKHGVRIALGSASKNAPLILDKLGITFLFDAVIDGNAVHNAKPDPEVFTKGAQSLHLLPEECAVFEDSVAGIEAAKNGGMVAVGVGTPERLPRADVHVADLAEALQRRILLS